MIFNNGRANYGAFKNSRLFSTIKELLSRPPSSSKKIQLQGWVMNKRKSKNVSFLELSDGSTIKGLQCVIPNRHSSPSIASTDVDSSSFSGPNSMINLGDIHVGCSLNVTGKLIESMGSGQSHEVLTESIEIVGPSDSKEFPVQAKGHSWDFYRSIPHLRQRSKLFQAISKIRHECLMAVHEAFHSIEFTHLHTPLMTRNDCEGGGEVFTVSAINDPNFFNSKRSTALETERLNSEVSLTVSSQIHLEMAAHGLGRVYTISPCFRADLGSEMSSRHLAEFYMVEAEWCWPKKSSLVPNKFTDNNFDSDLGGLMNVSEFLIKSVSRRVLERNDEELEYLEKQVPLTNQYHKKNTSTKILQTDFFSKYPLRSRIEKLSQSNYSKMSYDDAFKLLESDGNRAVRGRKWDQGFNAEQERWIANHSFSNGNVGLFIYGYPGKCKPFYMKQHDNGTLDDKTVECFDLILPGVGELIGGSVREDNYDTLMKRMKEFLDSESLYSDLRSYVELRKFGTCPHGGFGLGFDRLLMLLTGVPNIKDLVLFGRWRGYCEL